MSKSAKRSAQDTPDTSLSRKRKLALIAYLAILFIVALAVVTLSLVIQIHNNTEKFQTITEKAYNMQEENLKLKDENAELNTQLEDTARAYDLLLKAKDAYETKDDDAFRTAMDELAPLCTNLSEQAQETYSLLLTAMATATAKP